MNSHQKKQLQKMKEAERLFSRQIMDVTRTMAQEIYEQRENEIDVVLKFWIYLFSAALIILIGVIAYGNLVLHIPFCK